MDPTLRKILLGSTTKRPQKKAFSEEPAASPAPSAGESCPHCKVGRLDYDGCLNLVCPRCGYLTLGTFT